jgi:hypothetical protein
LYFDFFGDCSPYGFAKEFGFRGATLHGLNDIILATGLAVDYRDVSQEAEKMRLALTNADLFEIDFELNDVRYQLTIQCGGQDAQKSHGLCLGRAPDIANLPAGEVYFVPTGASGKFPMKFDDGTLAIMEVSGGRITTANLVAGDADLIKAFNHKLKIDPVTGEIGELGFGTQDLPVSGRDIQDEKVLGTLHVATGRSDHLGGHLTPDLFAEKLHATHDDILFSPSKTPEIYCETGTNGAGRYDGNRHSRLRTFELPTRCDRTGIRLSRFILLQRLQYCVPAEKTLARDRTHA